MDYPLDRPLHELACDRHPAGAEALVHAPGTGSVERLSFGQLRVASVELARRLADAGVAEGEPVAVCLPQGPLGATVHLALSRVGAVSVPLSPLLGPDALAPRLAGARLAFVDEERADAFREAAPGTTLWRADGGRLRQTRGPLPPPVPHVSWSGPPPDAAQVGERPLALFFTSGTTAAPKGALLPHRVIPGRMGGFLAAHGGAPGRFWSPADWAWIGGLHDALFAPLVAGVPVVTSPRRGAFDAAQAAGLVEALGVESAFLPPTALRSWRRSGARVPLLRTLHTAGEPLAAPVRAWAEQAFGARVREVYGMTEAAFLLVDGSPAPGARVGFSPEGEVLAGAGTPTLMLGYLAGGLPLRDGWFHTGDLADASGFVTGRMDDIIKTSGYRVSPGEVESELLRHPAVTECAVVGAPDEVRGQVIVAHVVASVPVTEAALQDFVRERLARHMVPRRIVFAAELPKTVSGKVVRRHLVGS